MITRRKVIAFLCTLVALLFASCKSTPKEKTETPAPVETPKEETPVEQPKEETPAEQKSDYSESNAALLQKVADARSAAVAAGGDSANPAAFKAAEAEYAVEQKASADDSSKDLSAALNDLVARYNAITSYAQAKAKKDRIDSLNFAGYDQSDYNAGSKILEELSDPVANVSAGSDLYKKADAADKDFDAVLTAGFKAQAKAAREEAYKAKQNADSVKASVSRKADYDAAVALFNKGDSEYVTKNPEGAASSYTASKDSFTKLYTEISDARAKAQAAIDAAKKRVADSESVASTADTTTPLGDTKVEGIEDENAKLLEEDDFSSTSGATEVSETITDDEGVPAK